MAEFAYNNSYHFSVDITPFEAPYGSIFRSFIGWFETFEVRPRGTELPQEWMDIVRVIQDRLRKTQSRQKAYPYCRLRTLRF